MQSSCECSSKKNIKLHRTKCSCLIINVISPSMLKELKDDINNKYYSLILDESTDVSTIKYMCIVIRYFSCTRKTIVSTYLGMVQVISTTADSLFIAVKDFMTEMEIPLGRLVGIGVDGASNMCGVHNSLFMKLRELSPQLVLIKCVCHSLNLCSEKSCNQLPSSLDFLLMETYSWFSRSTKRKVDYNCIYTAINSSPANPNPKGPKQVVQLTETRWLSRLNAIKVILDQWLELKTHFTTSSIAEHCYKARILAEMYSDDTNRLYLLFLGDVLQEINSVNLLFQKDFIDHFSLFTELKALTLSFLRRILHPKSVKLDINLSFESIYLNVKDVDFGYKFEHELNSTKSNVNKQQIKERCFNFLHACVRNYLRGFQVTSCSWKKFRI